MTMIEAECPNCLSHHSPKSLYWRSPRFLRCDGCGIIFRDPFPDDATLARWYEEGWESLENREDNKWQTGSTDHDMATRILSSLGITLGVSGLAGMRILDYGAGRGAMSCALMAHGANVVAVDPFGHHVLVDLGIT